MIKRKKIEVSIMWVKKMMATTVVATLLVGCSDEQEPTTVTTEPVEETEEQDTTNVEAVKQEVTYVYPLTGLPAKEEIAQRSIAVTINNHPKARPQTGLHKADIVYEVLAEGDVTRFLAIYQSEMPEKFGPVRSSRDYFIELAKGYDSIYIAHGYSPEARQMLESGYIDNMNGIQYDGTLFKRDSSRVAPHNSYITYDSIVKGATKLQFDLNRSPEALPYLTEEEVETLTGQPAPSVMVSYYKNPTFTSVYEYNQEMGKYTRISGGVLTADRETNEPVLIDNIFIIETDHKVVDNAGRRDINLFSGGNALLIREGVLEKVQWMNDEGRIVPVRNGQKVAFAPGKTWIHIVPSLIDFVSYETIETN
jgi:hypothetical protein